MLKVESQLSNGEWSELVSFIQTDIQHGAELGIYYLLVAVQCLRTESVCRLRLVNHNPPADRELIKLDPVGAGMVLRAYPDIAALGLR